MVKTGTGNEENGRKRTDKKQNTPNKTKQNKPSSLGQGASRFSAPSLAGGTAARGPAACPPEAGSGFPESWQTTGEGRVERRWLRKTRQEKKKSTRPIKRR